MPICRFAIAGRFSFGRNSCAQFQFRWKRRASHDVPDPDLTFAVSVAGARRKIKKSMATRRSNSFRQISRHRTCSHNPRTTNPTRLPFDKIDRFIRVAACVSGLIRPSGTGSSKRISPYEPSAHRESRPVLWQDWDRGGSQWLPRD